MGLKLEMTYNEMTSSEMRSVYNKFKPGFASKLTKPKTFGLFVKNYRSLILHNRIQANYSFSIRLTRAEQSRCCRGLVCVREGPAHRWRNTSSTTNITASTVQNMLLQLSNVAQGGDFYLRVVTD